MRNQIKKLTLLIGLLLVVGTGCSNIPLLQPMTPTPPTSSEATPTPTSAPTLVEVDEPSTINLMIWLPPQFAPSQETEAGILLQERLDSFNQQYTNLQVNYRIKAETGTASMLESLYATSGVAPLVLPDLVLISTAEMQIAAEQSLIFPYQEGIPAEDDTDWYNLALSLSTFQNQRYLLPLGADALVMVYNSEVIETIPRNWNELIEGQNVLSFPVADPTPIFTIALYLSAGGILRDVDDNIILQAEPLTDVLTSFKQAQTANILPLNPTQIESDESAWSIFLEANDQLAVTWTSRYFGQIDETLEAAFIPTTNGQPYSLAKGWGWAIASPDPNKQAAAAELARFLTEAEFTGPWTEATYLLPLRPFALPYWESETNQILASQILPIAARVPAPNVLNRVGLPIRDSVLDVLTDVFPPEDAAQNAVDALGN